jgi:alpha-tubulin suppressor-like RCC1 family protein
VKVNADTSLSGVTKIIAIGHHNLALKSDGTLWAWGDNSSSQLGLGAGDTTDRNFAVQVTVVGITNWDLYVQQ